MKEPWPMLAYSYLRFSFSEQAKGDSIRRQIALRDEYLARKGLTLDQSFLLPPDKGRSAFRGRHRLTGNLRLFLDAVADGRIRKGSVLLVENLDRLTREDATEALELFMSILRAGVGIVTLSPEMEFKPGEMDFGRWVIALAEMIRGHSESAAKSSRGKAKWEARRAAAVKGPVSARAPEWLTLVDGEWVVDESAASSIRRVFHLAANGMGTGAIARTLNTEKVPPVGKHAKRWHDSYVYRLLVGRTVLGEYQPRRRGAAGWEPVGEPIQDYYPAVVRPETWTKARVALRGRRRTQGRQGEEVTNLFTALVVTPEGHTYAVRNRNYHLYLIPGAADAGAASKVPGVPYGLFEDVLLRWLVELKLDFGDDNGVEALELSKRDLEEQIAELEGAIRKRASGRLVALLGEKEKELEDVNERLQLAVLPKHNQFTHTQRLVKALAECPPEERLGLRRQIKQQVAFLVERIIVRSEGEGRNSDRRHWLTIQFRDGQTRGVWFDTGRSADNGRKTRVINHGLWSPDGKFRVADLDAMTTAYQ